MTRELRRDVMLPLMILMSIALITSAGTTALLARMAPAIEQIIAENLYSLEAVEQMLAALGEGGGQAPGDRFATALARAEGNVTEAAEREHLEVIERAWRPAIAGDPAERRRTIDALLQLAAINRGAVVRQDEEAKRLGYAGAWAAVFLGALSFAWALIAVGRARRRLIDPLQEVGAVLDAAHAGDTYRRCRHVEAPSEVETIMTGLDELLDARALRGFADQPSLRAVVDRQILVHLLEQRSGPAWVITGDGSVDAANRAGLAALSGEEGSAIRDQLVAAAAGKGTGLRTETIEGANRYLCERA